MIMDVSAFFIWKTNFIKSRFSIFFMIKVLCFSGIFVYKCFQQITKSVTIYGTWRAELINSFEEKNKKVVVVLEIVQY